MRPTSAAYRDAIGRSHRMATRVDVLVAGGGIQTLYTTIGGAVALDITAASRGRVDLQVVDDGTLGLVPTDANSLLAPYGNEVRVYRGLYLPDGTVELISLGIFPIDTAETTEGPNGLTIAITGLDRSGRIIDARFEDAYEIPAGTNVADAILTTVQTADPNVVANFVATTFTTPTLRASEGEDKWAFVQSIATASGLALFYDNDGELRLQPQTYGSAVAAFAEGEGGVLLDAARSWKRDGFNRMVVTGENTGENTPARAVETDENPLSPTYYYGPFGPKPGFFQSQFILTDEQAQQAALGLLAKQIGTTQEVSFDVLVDPSLEPLDVVRISRLRLGINEDHVIDQLAIPLAVDGKMSGSTRAVQVV